jgi:hypothetical protein
MSNYFLSTLLISSSYLPRSFPCIVLIIYLTLELKLFSLTLNILLQFRIIQPNFCIFNFNKNEERRLFMIVKGLSFGEITIDGETYDKDVIIDNGAVKRRYKAASKIYSYRFGHTPLSPDENIPWDCKRLIIGTGQSSALPVMDEVREIAIRRGIELVMMSTPEAVKHINDPHTNLILHLTC